MRYVTWGNISVVIVYKICSSGNHWQFAIVPGTTSLCWKYSKYTCVLLLKYHSLESITLISLCWWYYYCFIDNKTSWLRFGCGQTAAIFRQIIDIFFVKKKETQNWRNSWFSLNQELFIKIPLFAIAVVTTVLNIKVLRNINIPQH